MKITQFKTKPKLNALHGFSLLKLSSILFLVFHLSDLPAQTTLLNLSFKNADLREVFLEIKKQSGKDIIFNNNLIDKYNNETIYLKNVTLEVALDKILEGKKLSFKLSDGVIIIEPQNEKPFQEKRTELNQTIRGTIIDEEANVPLIGASVVILNSNPPKGTAADLEGNFKIENIPVGRYNIQVSYVGYQSEIISEVLVTTGKEVVINIGLKQLLTQMNEVTVSVNKDKPLNTMASVSARSFTVEETRRYAGGLDDPARMASAFAGVAVGNIQSNGIVIRGNAPRGLLWRLEGIDIPNPNHLAGQVEGGGVVTIFSSQLLANSDFYTGAFPAEYGNAMSGVFDMKLRNGNKEKYEHTFQIGMIGIDLASEGPINKKKGSSYLINYRYSTIDLIKKIGLLSTNETPGYQDLSFKFNFPTKKAGTFSLWGIGGLDFDNGTDEQDSTKWKYSFNRLKYNINQKMGASGLTHKYVIGSQTYIRSTIAVTGIQQKQYFTRLNDSLIRNPYIDYNDISGKLTLSSVLNHKFNSRNTIRAGIDYYLLHYNVILYGTALENDPTTYQNFVNQKGNSNLTETYVEHKYDISKDLTFTAGFHFNYFSLNENYSIEPRAAFKWQFAPQQTISLGYGKHSQIEAMRIYLVKLQKNGKDFYPNKNLESAQAHHIVFGYDWTINQNLRLKIEPYMQFLSKIPGVRDSSFSMINFSQDIAFHNSLINNTLGRNVGIDFTLERFLNNNFYYMFTFSLFDSKYKTDDEIWRNTRFNKGYVTNWLFGKEYFLPNNRILGVNGRFNLLGGDRYSPYKADPKNKDVITDEAQAFEKQYPSTYYLDITITFRINKLKYSGVWALQIKNILGTPSRNGFYYNYQTGKIDENNITFILPELSYKIEF